MTYLSNFCEKIFRIRRTFALLWLSEVAMPLLHGRVWEPGASEVDDVNPGTRSNEATKLSVRVIVSSSFVWHSNSFCWLITLKIMSSWSSESEKSFDSDESVTNFVPEVEIQGKGREQHGYEEDLGSDDELFADEPIADEEWTARNEEEMRTTRELEKKLSEATRRSWTRLWMVSVFFAPLTVFFLRYPKVMQLFSVVRLKCNNCERNLLQNISECYCCQELEGCGANWWLQS